MVYDGPILDNHFHLNRKGLFLTAANEFKRAGGTHLVLVHCPDFAAPPETLQGHRETYADTLRMAEEVRKEVELGVRVVLGPHPAAFAHQFQRWVDEEGEAGRERAVQNYRHSIEAALHFVHEGQAHAIGEVGRPHWPVSDDIWSLSNMLLEETMHLPCNFTWRGNPRPRIRTFQPERSGKAWTCGTSFATTRRPMCVTRTPTGLHPAFCAEKGRWSG